MSQWLKSHRFIRKAGVILVLMIVIYLIYIPAIGGLFLDIKTSFDPRVVIGLRIKEVPNAEIENLHLEQWQQDYYSKFNILPAVISLEYIYIPQKILSSGQIFCIDELSIVSILPESVESKLLESRTPLCLGSQLHDGMNQLILQPRASKAFVYNDYADQFWYPFDYRTLEFNIFVKGSFDNDTIFNPVIQVANTPSRWVSWVSLNQSKGNIDASEIPLLHILMTRPPVYIILSIFVPIGLLLLLRRLLRSAISRGSLWETILGLLLGLWSLTQVLIPNYIDFPTLNIYIILSMYVFLIFLILIISKEIDDLEKIEGIGPKVARVLYGAGFTSYSRLANSNPEVLRKILNEEGWQMMDPTSWIEQAQLATKGDWQGLKKLQDELKGGRRK